MSGALHRPKGKLLSAKVPKGQMNVVFSWSSRMNPFGNLSTNHSYWHVILFIYNLSPRLCVKRKYMMLSMMISGPRQHGNDIDVYLNPFVEDLKMLWVDGVEIFHAFAFKSFMMRAMLFFTINDFPAYGNLSRSNVKVHKACPIC